MKTTIPKLLLSLMGCWNKQLTALLLLSICVVTNLIAQPSISSFSPRSGPVGSTVNISGSGFNTVATANIVFFGSAKAEVISATSTLLTVRVPAGATYQPITVTSNNLTGYSTLPFVTTFTGGGSFNLHSLAITAAADSVPNTIFETKDLNFADFDGDGNTDAVVVDGRNDVISIYKNTSSNKITSFAPRQDLVTARAPNAITTGDLDGDGRPDLAISNSNSNTVSIYRNTSTRGVISFAPRAEIPMRSAGNDIKIGDLDGDGKPDIAVLALDLDSTNGLRSLVSVLRNNSAAGAISFEAQKDISVGFLTNNLCIGSLDDDLRPEIAVTSYASNRVLVLKNNSSTGQISFTAGPVLETGNMPVSLSIGDLDLDGRQDLASANIQGLTVSLFRNISIGGTLAFAPRSDLGAGTTVSDVEISDLDGDGKPDLAVCGLQKEIVLLRNRSSAGSFSFDSRMNYLTSFADDFSIADVNNDGQPDLGVISGFYRVLFWENKIGDPFIYSFFPREAATGDTIKIDGSNFINVTSVMIGGQPASWYQVISPTLIQAVTGATVSGNITVTTDRGNYSESGFVFKAPPIIKGFTPAEGGYGKTITITGHNFTGTSVVKFGGVPAMSFQVVSADVLTATVSSGASGSIEITNRYGTGTFDGFVFMPVPVINSFTPLAATAGATVTIHGKFLATTTAVQIGGKPASAFTVINDSTVTAIVGSGTSGSVSVTTRGGTVTKPGFYIVAGITSFTPTAAAEGDTVTIHGTNLWQVRDVYFGTGRSFSITHVSDTIIKVRVTGDASSGTVTLNSTHGSTALPGFTFIPRPVITSISPVVGGKGTLVTITGHHYENVFSVTIGGVPPAKYTVVSPTSIVLEVGDEGSGPVIVKTRGGASTTPYHNFRYTTLPLVNHFSPAAAPVGSEVTITGANFDPVAANNIVYFGPVRSTVTHATMNSLKVLVPSGASYQPISVTTKNLTAYSGKPFVVTFKGDTSLAASTFAQFLNLSTGKTPAHLASADLDNDGKTELIVANKGTNTVSIFRNIGVNGDINFAPKTDVAVAEGPYLVAAADMDGDGKKDLIVFSRNGTITSVVLRNTTTNGSISFADPVAFDPGSEPKDIAIGDIDDNGKPDILIISSFSGITISKIRYVTVFFNASTPGNIIRKSYPEYITLSKTTSWYNDSWLNSIAVGDLNNDGRPDFTIGYANEYYHQDFAIVSGANSGSFFIGTEFMPTRNVLVGDFDVDGKLDIIDEKYVYRYKHNFTFDYDRVDGVGDNSVITDVNGDGKVDVVTLKPFAVSVFRNTSVPGAASFKQKMDFATGALTSDLIAGDFNGDGRPEIVVSNLNDNTISIFKNRSGSGIIKICQGAGTLITSNISGNSHHWQVNDGNGFVNISDNSTYTGSNTSRLQLTNTPAGFNGLAFRCFVDGIASNTFTLEVVSLKTPSISLTSSATNVCSKTPVTFTAAAANIGTDPVFRWFLNDVAVPTYNLNVYSTYLENNNDKVKVQLTSNDGCITSAVATSNVITTAVTRSVTPTAVISSSAQNIICEGTPVTFSSTITNGGDAPQYQWQLNGVNTGITSPSFSTNALRMNDQVRLILTSNATCATSTVINSNVMTVAVYSKPVAKALAVSNICINKPYTVRFSSDNTVSGSVVELWQSTNGNAFMRVTSKTFTGTTLEFQLNSGNTNATDKYFFSVSAPATITCSGPVNSDTVTVQTSVLLKPVITIKADSLTVTNSDAGTSYFWQQLQGSAWTDVTSQVSNKSMKMSSTGSFRVRAEMGGCIEISESLAIVVTGLPDLQAKASGIKLHPNPTISLLTLDSLALSDKWETLEIMHADGTKSLATFNIKNKTSITIHLEQLPQGLYLAVFRRRSQKPAIIKFIKM